MSAKRIVYVPAGNEGGVAVGEVRRATKREILLAALSEGIVTRQWWCYSDNRECGPDDERHYLHANCRWYWSMWTVEQGVIEALFLGTTPEGVIETDAVLSPQQVRELKERWQGDDLAEHLGGRE